MLSNRCNLLLPAVQKADRAEFRHPIDFRYRRKDPASMTRLLLFNLHVNGHYLKYTSRLQSNVRELTSASTVDVLAPSPEANYGEYFAPDEIPISTTRITVPTNDCRRRQSRFETSWSRKRSRTQTERSTISSTFSSLTMWSGRSSERYRPIRVTKRILTVRKRFIPGWRLVRRQAGRRLLGRRDQASTWCSSSILRTQGVRRRIRGMRRYGARCRQ